jgi:hypothetical protein
LADGGKMTINWNLETADNYFGALDYSKHLLEYTRYLSVEERVEEMTIIATKKGI